MRQWIWKSCTIVVSGTLLAAGCGGGRSRPDSTLTERQRDSVIATEQALPGSGVVGRALATSDSAAAQARRMDQQAGGGDASETK